MHAPALHHHGVGPITRSASTAARLFVSECDRDTPGIALPRAEVHIVVRFGPAAERGLDVHALGVRETVHRKSLRSGQRTVTARLHLGRVEGVLGVPASALAGCIVPLDELWGEAATRRLLDRMAGARDANDAAAALEHALAERLASAGQPRARARLALDAAERLTQASVNTVAADLAVSERHLRRIFWETLGVSPKAFARLTRFRHAMSIAGAEARVSWASIAAAAGYYDQAHLIAEFRAITGKTPRAFLGELRAARAIA